MLLPHVIKIENNVTFYYLMEKGFLLQLSLIMINHITDHHNYIICVHCNFMDHSKSSIWNSV